MHEDEEGGVPAQADDADDDDDKAVSAVCASVVVVVRCSVLLLLLELSPLLCEGSFTPSNSVHGAERVVGAACSKARATPVTASVTLSREANGADVLEGVN